MKRASHVGPDKSAMKRAAHMDPEIKASCVTRLKRIEGQVRGLQKMVEEERYCADTLAQVSSVQEALRSVTTELLRNHMRHCATKAIKSGDESIYDELADLMRKHVR